MEDTLTLALPKGRLQEQIQEQFETLGIKFSFENRKLVARDEKGTMTIMLVKNSDLPTYVNHGIAGMGVCGEDVIYESGSRFYRLHEFEFGSTAMCLAAKKDYQPDWGQRNLTVATKFPQFTQDYFHDSGIPVKLIKLNGSVELAPILGLAPYIVDLVETGNTLRANNLEVLKTLKTIKVYLIANPAYYKLHFKKINAFLDKLKGKV